MAALPVDLYESALEEATAAHRWYAQRSPAAALRFLDELDVAIAAIAEHPDRWPTHMHSTRRFRLRRFPFLIVYRVRNERVEVIACQHTSRRPGYWRERLQ